MTGENVVMYFAKNDMAMEKATEFPKTDLEGAALFPAIATKNQILDINFGQLVRELFSPAFIPAVLLVIIEELFELCAQRVFSTRGNNSKTS